MATSIAEISSNPFLGGSIWNRGTVKLRLFRVRLPIWMIFTHKNPPAVKHSNRTIKLRTDITGCLNGKSDLHMVAYPLLCLTMREPAFSQGHSHPAGPSRCFPRSFSFSVLGAILPGDPRVGMAKCWGEPPFQGFSSHVTDYQLINDVSDDIPIFPHSSHKKKNTVSNGYCKV